MDSSRARSFWNWQPQTSLTAIFEEIAQHAAAHRDWLDLSADF
jgi:hypothetical protein